MRKQVFALVIAASVLVAARPGSDPIITIDGVAKAAMLSAEHRTALAPAVKALNTRLEQMAATLATAKPGHKSTPHVRAELAKILHDDPAMKEIHELMQQLTPEQRAALHEYFIKQLKDAGLELPEHIPHGPGH